MAVVSQTDVFCSLSVINVGLTSCPMSLANGSLANTNIKTLSGVSSNTIDSQDIRKKQLKHMRTDPSFSQQKNNKAKKTQMSHGGAKKKVSPAQKRIRRRLKLKKEEEEEEEEEAREEEETVVEYMDSDEEEKKKKKTKEEEEVLRTEEVEKQEEEKEYTFPPMHQWTPAERAQSCSFLSFRPVELPSSGDSRVRSTILGQFGRSVIVGSHPRELQWEKRHSSSCMMMVTADQLRAHLHHQAGKFTNQNRGPGGKVRTGKQSGRGPVKGLDYELQAAVTPWIGNLLIPVNTRPTTADALREGGERTQLSSTPIFLLLLQTMNVDSVGCKEMIEERRKRVVLLTPPQDPSCVRTKTPKTIGRALQQRKVKEELQHKRILEQFQALRQPFQPQQLMLLKQPPFPHPPSMTSHSHPGIPLQVPPNMHAHTPVPFPRAVFFSHPEPGAASVQNGPPSSLTAAPPAPRRPPPSVVTTSPLPAPPAPQRLNVPPVSVVLMPVNAAWTRSASSCRQAGPVTQSLILTLPPPPNQDGTSGSAPPSQPCAAPSPEDQQDVCSSQHVVDVGGAGDGGTEEGRRTQKLSLMAKALQGATEARIDTSSSQKKAEIQITDSPPQQISTAPAQLVSQTPQLTTPPAAPPPAAAAVTSCALTKTDAPSLPSAQESAPPPLSLDVPPVSECSSPLPQKATPVCSNGAVSSTQNLSLAPPPSVPANWNTVSCPASPPAPFHNDHDYSSVQPSPSSKQPKPTAPSRGRKRVRGEEQLSEMSAQADTFVGGTSTGVIQEGKRVRKLSQRARALQEAQQDEAEAKKKRRSSPQKKRSRASRPKKEVVEQKQEVTQLPGLCLHPGQSMWVMTPGGLVQLAKAPPQGLQLALVPSSPLPAPPGNIVTRQPATARLQPPAGALQSAGLQAAAVLLPVNLPGQNKPHPLPAPPACPSKSVPPTVILKPVPKPVSSPLPSCLPQPPPKLFLPYKGTIRADPATPPPLRREALQFDPSLMFLESRAAVRDWLSGRGGVVVPGAGVALPYLPPFVSSLNTLRALLRAKTSLTKSSLQLLCRGSEPRHPQTKPKPDSSTKRAPGQPPDLPDSTSDLGPAADKPAAPSVSSDPLQEEAEEAELVAAVRHLVAERFSGNPAYLRLKARFLSCFTVPALLATMQPITEKTVSCQANEEEEEEDDDDDEEEEEEIEELKKIQERGKQRKAERSLLVCDASGAPANQFSGINTSTPTADWTGPDQTGPDQTSRNPTVTVSSENH